MEMFCLRHEDEETPFLPYIIASFMLSLCLDLWDMAKVKIYAHIKVLKSPLCSLNCY